MADAVPDAVPVGPLGLTPAGRRRLAIAMVCDFVYPRLGGVEMHIWSLAQCLVKMGHKVIIVTNIYNTSNGKRVGVRHMTNGVKMYYMPIVAMFDQATMPTYYAFFPLFRKILIRERIDIVHGHAATSPLQHECLLQAKSMGYKAIFTDHSLFGFADAASINVNKYLKFTLSNIDHCICVSHTDRENLVLRAALDPRSVSAIPNAVDASKFTPDPSARPASNRLNIVMLSRLVYRKGIDLVVNVIPAICAQHPHVHFIIGGDGPKKLLLEEMRERHQLHDRVELLGAVPHKNVRDVLTRGHIFLNCSLTEAFCIAILEAACCGCFVVSTRVGGVPEVLPPEMIKFADPEPDSLITAINAAIPLVRYVDAASFHDRLKDSYNWPEVAERTITVYERVVAQPPTPLVERFRRFFGVGRVFGILAVIAMALFHFMASALEAIGPADSVDVVPDTPLHLIGLEAPTYRRKTGTGGGGAGAPAGGSASASDSGWVDVPASEAIRRDYAAVARPNTYALWETPTSAAAAASSGSGTGNLGSPSGAGAATAGAGSSSTGAAGASSGSISGSSAGTQQPAAAAQIGSGGSSEAGAVAAGGSGASRVSGGGASGYSGVVCGLAPPGLRPSHVPLQQLQQQQALGGGAGDDAGIGGVAAGAAASGHIDVGGAPKAAAGASPARTASSSSAAVAGAGMLPGRPVQRGEPTGSGSGSMHASPARRGGVGAGASGASAGASSGAPLHYMTRFGAPQEVARAVSVSSSSQEGEEDAGAHGGSGGAGSGGRSFPREGSGSGSGGDEDGSTGARGGGGGLGGGIASRSVSLSSASGAPSPRLSPDGLSPQLTAAMASAAQMHGGAVFRFLPAPAVDASAAEASLPDPRDALRIRTYRLPASGANSRASDDGSGAGPLSLGLASPSSPLHSSGAGGGGGGGGGMLSPLHPWGSEIVDTAADGTIKATPVASSHSGSGRGSSAGSSARPGGGGGRRRGDGGADEDDDVDGQGRYAFVVRGARLDASGEG